MVSLSQRILNTESEKLGAFVSQLLGESLEEWQLTDALWHVSIQVTQLNKSEWVVRVTQPALAPRVFRIELAEVLMNADTNSNEGQA